MRAHPLSDAIIEVGVEEFLGLHRLIGIAQQALGEDQRMALVVVGTNHLLNGMANHVDVDGTRTVVLCEVDPIGVLHVDRVFPSSKSCSTRSFSSSSDSVIDLEGRTIFL